jgi:hypothetical protein
MFKTFRLVARVEGMRGKKKQEKGTKEHKPSVWKRERERERESDGETENFRL